MVFAVATDADDEPPSGEFNMEEEEEEEEDSPMESSACDEAIEVFDDELDEQSVSRERVIMLLELPP